MTKDEIFAEAMTLEPNEREALADELLLSISSADRDAIDAAWSDEARRRDAAFAAGRSKAVPVDEAIERLLSRGRS